MRPRWDLRGNARVWLRIVQDRNKRQQVGKRCSYALGPLEVAVNQRAPPAHETRYPMQQQSNHAACASRRAGREVSSSWWPANELGARNCSKMLWWCVPRVGPGVHKHRPPAETRALPRGTATIGAWLPAPRHQTRAVRRVMMGAECKVSPGTPLLTSDCGEK